MTGLADGVGRHPSGICMLVLGVILGCVAIHGRPPQVSLLTMVTGSTTTVRAFEKSVEENMRKAGVSGLSVAIINDRKLVYTQQFGWKDKDAGTTLDDTTAFAAGSLSKTIVAYLTLALERDGQIDVDRPLQDYLPKPLPRYAGYAELESDPRYRLITPRMVLSHTTGLPNLRSSSAGGRLQIQFQPGSRFSYSGEGFRLLQLVLEAVMQTDLETLAKGRVFGPFGMRQTSFVWRDALAKNMAAPHNEFGWAADPDRPPTADASGSLLTTAQDYARFLVGLLTADEDQAGLVRRMWTPHVRITSSRMFAPQDRPPALDSSGNRLSWALGWGELETRSGRAVFHTGHKAGAQNYVVVYPDRGIGMVLLSNSDNFESVAAEIVTAGIGDRESPVEWLGYVPFDPTKRKAAPPRRVAIAAAPAVIANYAGTYEFGPGAVVHIKVDGNRLYASDDGQSWDELLAQSEDVFFFAGRTLTIRFVKDASGRVTRIEVDNNGAKVIAQRIR